MGRKFSTNCWRHARSFYAVYGFDIAFVSAGFLIPSAETTRFAYDESGRGPVQTVRQYEPLPRQRQVFVCVLLNAEQIHRRGHVWQ
jgi:hypothetical protein